MAGRDDDKDKTVFGGPPQGKPRGTTDIWSRGPQGGQQGQGGDDGRTMIGRPGQAGSPFGGDQHTASPFGQPQGGGLRLRLFFLGALIGVDAVAVDHQPPEEELRSQVDQHRAKEHEIVVPACVGQRGSPERGKRGKRTIV